MSKIRIALIGNPNCGKTTLFNALTGSKQQVGNWPGVTVERKSGFFRQHDSEVEVVDLPGIYALSVSEHASADEIVARDYALSGQADFFVNIVDASNLERNLYLTTQLLELGVPVMVALNMIDAAREQGVEIDAEALSRRLGCPVVPVIATRKHGLDALKKAIVAHEASNAGIALDFAPTIETAIDALLPEIGKISLPRPLPARWLAIKLLEGDHHAETLCAAMGSAVKSQLIAIEKAEGLDADILVADARYRFANSVSAEARRVIGQVSRGLTTKIDKIVLHRVLGIPIFLAIMYLMFLFSINVGSAFIDFFDQAFAAIFVDAFGGLLESLGAPEWLKVLLADGAGGGIQTVATFIPVIGCLYIALSILEDSGYMARAAFVMDRAMRAIGLPGKSFVPLIVGFGCNIPAIMAARTLEHKRDRIMTILMAPFMSCGARLPVYALFAAAFFPENGQNIVFALYLIGILVAILTGFLLKKTLLKGDAAPFLMELPLYHIPTAFTVLRRSWDRLRDFVINAGQIIVPMVMVLSILNSVGTDGSFGNEDSEKSVLAAVGHQIVPIFKPIGIEENNWQAAVGLFTGILAKEAVVGTLNALYASADGGAEAEDEEETTLGDKLVSALQTIPDNLADLGSSLTDPLGVNVEYVGDQEAAAEELEADSGVFQAMQKRFDGGIGAFAYLLIILLYTPCVAANGAVRNELGMKWMTETALWTFFTGYAAATVFYQLGNFARHPGQSIAYTALMAGILAAIIMACARVGRRKPAAA